MAEFVLAPGEDRALLTNHHIGDPPQWVSELVGPFSDAWEPEEGGLQRRHLHADGYALTSVRLPGAAGLGQGDLHRRVQDVYAHVSRSAASSACRHVVRIWNFIPGLLEPLGDLPQRYMVFNSARFAAFERWFGGAGEFSRTVPTASGVGHLGDDLVVHALAAELPGIPVENPRQIPSYRYCESFGPQPPCFARATLLSPDGPHAGWLVVGGTASIRGQDTHHAGDLRAQVDETLANLAALIAAAGREPSGAAAASEELGRLRHVRTYHRRQQDGPAVRELLEPHLSAAHSHELVQADLCREPLLVEIEGVAVV